VFITRKELKLQAFSRLLIDLAVFLGVCLASGFNDSFANWKMSTAESDLKHWKEKG
jgi:hypothetical protein